ncbi:MAG: flippase [Gemmatimonadota bacterium]
MAESLRLHAAPGKQVDATVIQPLTAALLARNATRNLIALGVPLIVALATLPVLVSRLGTTHFGLLGLVWVFFGLFAELGLGKATTKYAAEAFADADGGSARGVLRLGVLLQLALGIVLGIALAAGADPLAAQIAGTAGVVGETRAVLYVVAASLPVVMVSAAYRGVVEAAHRFDLVNRVRIPLTVSTYLLPAILVLTGSGLVSITIALAAARVLGTLCYAALAWRVVREYDAARAAVAERPVTRAMMSFGAWQTASGLLAPLLACMDRFMLGGIAGVAAVGLYTPAFEIASRLLILPAGVVTALFPAFSAWSAAEAARSARTAARAVLYISAALAPIVVVVIGLGADGLALWLGAVFARETATALAILAMGALLNAAAYVPATLLQGAGRPDIPTKLYLVELPLYMMLMVVLITRWGVIGAAAAWSIRVAVDAMLLFSVTHITGLLPMRELVDSRVPQTLLGLAALALAPAAAAAGLEPSWLRLVVTGAAAAVAVAFLWTYSLRAEGRARIAEALGFATT